MAGIMVDAAPRGLGLAQPASQAAEPAWAATGARLARALLGYYLAIVAVIVFVPFRFAVPEQLGWVWLVNGSDFAANVLLFVPFGFLYRVARREPSLTAWHVGVAGVAASMTIEMVQMWEPHRYASLLDVVANGGGAWLGAVLCGVATRRLEAPALVGRLSLELPLMGLVYLLVPLLWTGSVAMGGNELRLWMLALPVAFGATLLGLVQRHHFGPANAASTTTMALAAAAGVLLGGFPALARSSAAVPGAAGVAGMALLAAAIVVRHARGGAAIERRFEVPALRTAIPFYAAYLLACALAPLTEPQTVLGILPAATGKLRTIDLLRLLHSVAAFTLLGYIIAEVRSRFEQPFVATSRRVMAFSLPAAAATIAVTAAVPGAAGPWSLANLALWLVLAAGGAQYGAWLYHLQREHVRTLIAPPAPPGPVRF